MPIDYLVSALVTLVVVVDPVGLVPTFLAVTHGLPQQARRRIAVRASNVAAFPLAIPLMAGPGAITATLLLAGQAAGKPISLAILIAVVVAVCALCLGVFLLANRVDRLLGITGNVVSS